MFSSNVHETLENYVLEKMPRKATVKSYETAVKVFTADTGITDLMEITKQSLLRWRVDVVERASETSWNTYLRHMRALGNYAVKEEVLETNIFKEVGFLKAPKKSKKVVDQVTLAKAVDIIRNNPSRYKPVWFWKVVLETLYYTGIRRRQIIGIRWSDLNFQQHTIRLRSDSSKNAKEWVIPMFQAEEGLRELQKRTMKLKGSLDQEGQVFNVTLFNCRYKSSEMKVDNISGFFRKITDDLPEAESISSHRLRHTFGTETAKTGDIRTVQEMMGHSDIRTTCEYIHPDLQQMNQIGGTMPAMGKKIA